MEKKKSTGLLLSILGVISLILITAGVTYAFFSYTKEGTQPNTITTGAITFRYDEGQTALTLNNALPMGDENGATQTATNKFSFTVESTTPSTVEIPYVVTVRKDASSTLDESQVKIYLKAGTGAATTADTTAGIQTGAVDTTNHTSTVKTFSTLASTGTGDYAWFDSTYKSNLNASNDKIIFTGKVPANANATGTGTYKEYFDLGMWLLLDNSQNSTMADYSAYEFVHVGSANTSSGASVTTLRGTACNDNINSSTYTGPALITSTEYYALDANIKSMFRRIAYVNYAEGKIIEVADTTNSETQATPSSMTNWSANEQYYPMNAKTFSVKVNVYSKGTVYTAPQQG